FDFMPDRATENDMISPRALGILTALEHAGISIVLQDSALGVQWSHNLPEFFQDHSEISGQDEDVIPHEEGKRIVSLKRQVIETAEAAHTETSVSVNEQTAWFEVWVDPILREGKVTGIMTTMAEITDRKRREQTLRTLLR